MKTTYEGGQMPLFRRLPKRGFKNGPFRVDYATVNVSDLGVFPAGSVIGLAELQEKGLLTGRKGLPLKVLGDGELQVALTVKADRFSKSAAEKIEKAGGRAEWLAGIPKKKAPNFVRIEREKKFAEIMKKGGTVEVEEKKEEKGEKTEKQAGGGGKEKQPRGPSEGGKEAKEKGKEKEKEKEKKEE
jgi:ribosomal protein L15